MPHFIPAARDAYPFRRRTHANRRRTARGTCATCGYAGPAFVVVAPCRAVPCRRKQRNVYVSGRCGQWRAK